MDISLVAAKILGLYLVISGLFVIFRGKTIPTLLKDFFDHPATVYLTGIILIFLSTLMLIQNNVWDGTWRTLITLLSWAVLIKGIMYIFMPQALHKMVNKKVLGSLKLYGFIAILVGLFFYTVV